mmetsp:Transcript_22931/g.28815  ORF Transcript_22931/g.28815 Transcript_22931/m.28815 type:complete len:723 (+) Transcript_22931:67-2235(+)
MDRREPFFSNTKWLKGAAFLLMFVLLLSKVENSNSVVAKPESFRVLQPDGNFLNMILKGDAFCNWLEDDKGNVIVRSGEEFYYANGKRENGKLAPSEFKVGHQDPQSLGLNKDLRPEGKKQKLDKMRKKLNIDSKSEANSGHEGRRLSTLITTGSLKNLVIPVMFNDHQDRDLPSKEDIAVLWNAPNGHPTYYDSTNMSIRDFYLENSYGLLDINSTVLDWVLVSENEAYYGAGESGGATQLMELLNEVLDYVDDLVDFSEFDENGDGYIDAIAFVHSGYGAEYGGTDVDGQDYEDRIWSHKWSLINTTIWWYDPFVSDESVMVLNYHMETILDGVSGSQISTIAVGAHETGHFLGLPDLYDTDYSSSGISSWGIMANSWGWSYTGEIPPSFSAWSKYRLGWLNPINITESGSYSLGDIQTTDSAFMISAPYPGKEYLLIEYRAELGWDREQGEEGLLIWHIDDSIDGNSNEGYYGQANWPENGNHYQVALLQADGSFDLEQGYGADSADIFASGTGEMVYDSVHLHPSSISYKDGDWYRTNFTIEDIYKSGSVFNFTVYTNHGSMENSSDYSASCDGYCGGSPGSCWCDAACMEFDDCCDDYLDMCPYNFTANSTASPTPTTASPTPSPTLSPTHEESPTASPTPTTASPSPGPTPSPTHAEHLLEECSDDNDCPSSKSCVCLAAQKRKLRSGSQKEYSRSTDHSKRRNLLFGNFDDCFCM